MDFWREGRHSEGWKAFGREEEDKDEHAALVLGNRKAPRFVSMAPRLTQDIHALMALTAFEEAPRMEVRASSSAAAYLVGDASGSGFGDCLWVQGEEGMNIAFGSWNKEVSESSSNFREGYNLVLRLENLLQEGAMCRGTELWVFTDNAVAESSFNKGASKSKLLHDLCVRLRKAEMAHGLHIHMVWIAGTHCAGDRWVVKGRPDQWGDDWGQLSISYPFGSRGLCTFDQSTRVVGKYIASGMAVVEDRRGLVQTAVRRRARTIRLESTSSFSRRGFGTTLRI